MGKKAVDKKVEKTASALTHFASSTLTKIDAGALAEINQYLDSNPEEICQCLIMLKKGACKRSPQKTKEATLNLDIPASRTKLHLVSNQTLSNIVAVLNPKLVGYLGGDLCADEEELGRKFFHMGTNSEPSWGVHEHAYEPFIRCYRDRYTSYGERLRDIPENITLKLFPWDLYGIYRKGSVETDVVKTMKHISGMEAPIPPKYTVKPSFTIESNWSERHAKLRDPDDDDDISIFKIFVKHHGEDNFPPRPTKQLLEINEETTSKRKSKKSDDVKQQAEAGVPIRFSPAKKRARVSTSRKLHSSG